MCYTAFNRAVRRRQRLPQNLAAEHLRTADIATLATKYIVFDSLENQQLNQVSKNCMHCVGHAFSNTAAVDHESGTADENGIVACQEENDLGDIDRVAKTFSC